jgi:hypothetical protein
VFSWRQGVKKTDAWFVCGTSVKCISPIVKPKQRWNRPPTQEMFCEDISFNGGNCMPSRLCHISESVIEFVFRNWGWTRAMVSIACRHIAVHIWAPLPSPTIWARRGWARSQNCCTCTWTNTSLHSHDGRLCGWEHPVIGRRNRQLKMKKKKYCEIFERFIYTLKWEHLWHRDWHAWCLFQGIWILHTGNYIVVNLIWLLVNKWDSIFFNNSKTILL